MGRGVWYVYWVVTEGITEAVTFNVWPMLLSHWHQIVFINQIINTNLNVLSSDEQMENQKKQSWSC